MTTGISPSRDQSRSELAFSPSFSMLRVFSFLSLLFSARSQLFPSRFDLSQLNGTNGFVVAGEEGNNIVDTAVANVGDINFDGVDDFLIGTSNRVHVLFGRVGLGENGTVKLPFKGVDGFAIEGEEPGDQFGFSIAGVGDVNNDRISDFAVGAHQAMPSAGLEKAGKVYVVFGRVGLSMIALSELNGTNGFVIRGKEVNSRFGYAVAGAGDFNADGIDDILIGSPWSSPASGRGRAGTTYLIFGNEKIGATGSLELSSLNKTDGCQLNGDKRDDGSGSSIASARDVNADGIVDILVGAPLADPANGGRTKAGQAYLLFGSRDLCEEGDIELKNSTGLVFDGEKRWDTLGSSVSSAGDLDGDGIADLVLSAPLTDLGGNVTANGEVYVIFGSVGLGSTSIDLRNLKSPHGLTIKSEKIQGANIGRSVAAIGDVNEDGIEDLLIGTRAVDQGRSYVIFGSREMSMKGVLDLASLNNTTGVVIEEVAERNATAGSVGGGGDFNGDGISDILIGAGLAQEAGQTYVIFGRTSRKPSPTTMSDGTTTIKTSTPDTSSTGLPASSRRQTTLPDIEVPSSNDLLIPIAVGSALAGAIVMAGVIACVWRCKHRERSIPDEGPEFESAREMSTEYGRLSTVIDAPLYSAPPVTGNDYENLVLSNSPENDYYTPSVAPERYSGSGSEG